MPGIELDWPAQIDRLLGQAKPSCTMFCQASLLWYLHKNFLR